MRFNKTIFQNRRNIIALRILLVFGFISAVSIYAWSYSGGINGRTGTSNGCNCHGTSPNTATTVSVVSQTGSFTVEAGSSTNFTVTVANSSMSRAGVNIAVKTTESGEANAGSLSPATGSGLQSSGSELTQSSPKNLSGGSASFDFSWTAPTQTGTYYLRTVGNAVNGNGSADAGDRWNFMSVQQITVVNSANITLTAPTASTVWCQGSSVNITWTSSGVTNAKIELSSDGGNTYPTVLAESVPASTGSYSWNIPASQSAGTQYRIRVSDVSTPSRNSASPNFAIAATSAITAHPAPVATCTGQQVSFSVTATGGSLTYQWRKNGTNIPNATNATFSIQSVATADAGNYDCVVSGACGSAITSNQAALTLDIAPKILEQPTEQETCAGGTVSFTVEAEATEITYQWQKDGENIAGATTDTYTIENVTGEHAGAYRVVVNGKCNTPVNSTAVNLIVNAPPEILQQPVSAAFCQGSSASFSVSVKGGGLLYQWRKNGVGLPNTNSPSLVIQNVNATHAGKYDVVINGKCQPGATSEQATLSIIAAPLIIQQPESKSVDEGASVEFTVAATGDNLSYQWRKDNVDLAGKTTPVLNLTNVTLADAGQYDCIIMNECGEGQSNAAVLTVNVAGPGPVLTLQHTSVSFGMVAINTERDTTFTKMLKNTGTEALTITNASITGADAASFSIAGFVTPLTLAVNEEAPISFTFFPVSAGAKSAQVQFTTNAASNPVITLSGTGGEVKITTEMDEMEFETSSVSEPVEMTLNLSNDGNMRAAISLSIEDDETGSFTIETSPTFNIEGGEGASVLLKFTPKSTDDVEAKLTVTIDGVLSSMEVELKGKVSGTSVDDLSGIEFDKFNVYPNPSTNDIKVDFTLSETKIIEASVIDVRGNVVKTFGAQSFNAGNNFIAWDGKNNRGESSPTGEYMLIFKIGKNLHSFPMMITK